MVAKINIAGKKFGRLTALSESGNSSGRISWLCQCDCGNTTIVCGSMLRTGNTSSCGCLRAFNNKQRATHNLRSAKEYSIWNQMIQRCNNKNNPAYKHYGGRGISVCQRWHTFISFYKDMGDRPGDNYSINRINNDGGYEPSNCEWADDVEQCNNRRTSRYITCNGVTKTLALWSKHTGIGRSTISKRIDLKWPIYEALTKGVK